MKRNRQHWALTQALALLGDSNPIPRLNALYRDARREWLARRSATNDLHELLLVMLHARTEVTPEDDAQIRLAYEIRRAA